MSEAELHEMMRDPRYWRDRDPEFIGRVTAGFRDLFGIAAGRAPEPSPVAEIATLRARVAELEASRARLVAYIYAGDDLEYAISCGDRGEIATKREAAVRARRLIEPGDLALETPHG